MSTTHSSRPKTLADLEEAARRLKPRLARLKPEHHAAEVRETIGPIAREIAAGAAAEVAKATTTRDTTLAQLRTARPIAPPGYSDTAAVVVRELRRQRLLDRLEAMPAHVRAEAVRKDLRAGRHDRLDALIEVDEHGEIVPLDQVEALRLERGRLVAPALAAKLDQAEADLEATVTAAHELGVMAVQKLKKAGLGNHADLIDRSAFLGRPTPPASYAAHLAAANEAEPAPAA